MSERWSVNLAQARARPDALAEILSSALRIVTTRFGQRHGVSYSGTAIEQALSRHRARWQMTWVSILAAACCPILQRSDPNRLAPLNYGTSLERITAESLTRRLSGFVLRDIW